MTASHSMLVLIELLILILVIPAIIFGIIALSRRNNRR